MEVLTDIPPNDRASPPTTNRRSRTYRKILCADGTSNPSTRELSRENVSTFRGRPEPEYPGCSPFRNAETFEDGAIDWRLLQIPLINRVDWPKKRKEEIVDPCLSIGKGGETDLLAAVIVGFIAMAVLSFMPILGPIIAGFIAGILAGGGAGNGAKAGFLSGVIGALLGTLLLISFSGLLGGLVGGVWGALLGGFVGGVFGAGMIVVSLVNAFLGLIGGGIGGAVRGTGK